MTTRSENAKRAKTVEMSFHILEYLKENDGGTLDGITDEFDKAKSTIHRHLYTLECLKYVIKENGEYYPSLRFLDFGVYTRDRKGIYALAEKKVEALAAETDEKAQLIVEEHGKGVIIHRAAGADAVQTDPGVGRQADLHTTAAGKAILAFLPRERVEAIIEHQGLPARTEASITTAEELFEQLEVIRQNGYSTNEEESTKGLHAVGVPIRGPDDQAIGALSISGPTRRLNGEFFHDDIASLLLGTANELELNFTDTQ